MSDKELRSKINALDKYLKQIEHDVKALHDDYIAEEDRELKAEKKTAYEDELKRFTLRSSEYKKLVNDLVKALTRTNQRAIDQANQEMTEVYAINYNQVADECKKVGIAVYGEKEKG